MTFFCFEGKKIFFKIFVSHKNYIAGEKIPTPLTSRAHSGGDAIRQWRDL